MGAVIIAAAAMQAASSLMSGYQQYRYGQYQQKQSEADAAAQQGAAAVQAERVRKLTQLQQGQARAALAGAGVDVNTGTALDINADIRQRGEQDAFAAILNGQYAADRINAEGKLAAAQGRDALAAGVLKAGSSLAQGASQYGDWKTAQAGRTVQAPMTPVSVQSGSGTFYSQPTSGAK